MPVKVKICGITSITDAQAAFALGADAIGLNFYALSPRAVNVEQAREIVASLPARACAVGVFVDAPRAAVAETAQRVGLSALQFHGAEPPEACLGWDLLVVKALPAEGPEPLVDRAARYPMAYLLVDAPSAGFGGSGRRFAWELAAAIPRHRLVVAGGLTPANVAEAVRALRPLAVDVASGVESSPGRKDHEKLKAFIDAAKAA
jgi:phosphoribosylanthranilate isomerase